jgi:hypothetical protein
MERTIRAIVMGSVSLLLLSSLWGAAALAETRKLNSDNQNQGLRREIDVTRILSVFEKKVEDPKLLERTREKLLTLGDTQFSLISSLSEQIIKEGNQPGVDIAFLLITILIVLS